MNPCDFPDNHPHRTDSLESRTCRRCGRVVTARLFPVRAKCRAERVVGLGDIVATAIKWVTLGRLKQKPGCGCKARQDRLNRWWSWWRKKAPEV